MQELKVLEAFHGTVVCSSWKFFSGLDIVLNYYSEIFIPIIIREVMEQLICAIGTCVVCAAVVISAIFTCVLEKLFTYGKPFLLFSFFFYLSQ